MWPSRPRLGEGRSGSPSRGRLGHMVDRRRLGSRCKQVRPRSKGCGMDWGDVGFSPLLTVLAEELTDSEARRCRPPRA